MAKLILVCGPTGAGKTTYSLGLSSEINAVRFSIDPWMQMLFSKDMTSLDFDWMMERVNRCHAQIWEVAKQILSFDGNVILDLGFTTKADRDKFFDLANAIAIRPEVHFIDLSVDVRKKRIAKRNLEKDPSVYSFEVTDMMFNFMEPKFEALSSEELKNCLVVNV